MTFKNEQEYVLDAIRLLMGRGKTYRQISVEMKLSLGKTHELIQIIKAQSKENINKYVNEELPLQYENTLSGINQILDICWTTASDKTTNTRDKNAALSLAMQAYAMRLEMLSSSDTLRNTIKFVDKHLGNRDKQNEVTKQPK